MRKINHEFLNKLHFGHGGRNPSKLFTACSKLKVGEMIFVSKEEWQHKARPRPRFEKKLISSRKCEEGWVLTRVK